MTLPPINNPPLPISTTNPRFGWTVSLAWIPIPFFLMFILGLWVWDIRTLYYFPYLRISLNFLFSTLAGVIIAFLTARSFSKQSAPGLLLFGCGALFWGFAGLIAVIATLFKDGSHLVNVNNQTTIHNLSIWAAAWCHLAGIGISLRWQVRVVRWRLWLVVAYLLTAVMMILIVQAAFSSSFPLFFLQGSGGTPVRQLVLGSSTVMLLLSALLLRAMHRKNYSLFLHWYSLALLLMATGLFGVMLRSVHSDPLGWLGRIAQALGGIYLLMAAVAAKRGHTDGTVLESCEKRFRYGVAMVLVLTAVIVRMIFLQDLELQSSFLTFYPAIIFSALYGGFGAGLLATVFSMLMANYFFVPPLTQINLNIDVIGTIIFFASGAIISWITAAMQRAQERAIRAEADTALSNERLRTAELLEQHNTLLEQRVNQRTRELVSTIEKLQKEISIRSIMEKELRHSEETLQLAIKSTGLGTFDFYPQTQGLYWSEIQKINFGISPDTDVNFNLFVKSIHPEDCKQVLQMVDHALKPESGGEYRLDYRVIGLEDGRVRWISERGQAFFNEAGQAVRFIGVSREITRELEDMNRRHEAEHALQLEMAERLKMVEALRKKEQLLIQQSRQAAMGEMIGNIAHQWRQPLNTLGLTIQQLQLFHDLGEFTREFLRESVDTSMELIQHMSRTIDDFRNYFQPDKEKVSFNVHVEISKTISLITGSFNSRQISVRVDAQVQPVAYGYPNEFSQALLNIMINARDALTERAIKNPELLVTISKDDGRTVVTIADNAGGIPEEILEKIFDPYFTTKGPQHGTGVGLFMSKAIIEKNMDGCLSVRNLAAGAEFRIEI